MMCCIDSLNYTAIMMLQLKIDGRIMVSHWSLTAEGRVRARVIPCGICGQSGTGEVSLRVIRISPVDIVPPWLSILMYHLGDEL
jgi:hypothetical protein